MDSLQKNKQYQEERKKKIMSDKVQEKIDKGKVLQKEKSQKLLQARKSRIASSQKSSNLTKKVSKGILIGGRKKTGEKQIFEIIRNTRPHYCILCKQFIKEAKSRCFAHLLAKGLYPKYRLNEANIAFSM